MITKKLFFTFFALALSFDALTMEMPSKGINHMCNLPFDLHSVIDLHADSLQDIHNLRQTCKLFSQQYSLSDLLINNSAQCLALSLNQYRNVLVHCAQTDNQQLCKTIMEHETFSKQHNRNQILQNFHYPKRTCTEETLTDVMQAYKGISHKSIMINNSDLIKAAETNNTDIIQILLQNGADIDTKDEYNKTSLIHAAMHGCYLAAKLLIAKKCNVDIQNQFGFTALHQACYNNQPDLLKLILEQTTKINVQDDDGQTPLHVATSCWKNIKCAQLLLQYGADITIQNNASQTALECARTPKVRENIEKFIKKLERQQAQKRKAESNPAAEQSNKKRKK